MSRITVKSSSACQTVVFLQLEEMEVGTDLGAAIHFKEIIGLKGSIS